MNSRHLTDNSLYQSTDNIITSSILKTESDDRHNLTDSSQDKSPDTKRNKGKIKWIAVEPEDSIKEFNS